MNESIKTSDPSIKINPHSMLVEETMQNNFCIMVDPLKPSFGNLETILIEDSQLKRVVWKSKEPFCAILTKGSSLNLLYKGQTIFECTLSSNCYSLTSEKDIDDNSLFQIMLCCSVV